MQSFEKDPILGDPMTWKKCKCPLPCESVEYTVQLSRAKLQENVPVCKNAANVERCLEQRMNDKVRLDVYLLTTGYFLVTEQPVYSVGVSLAVP